MPHLEINYSEDIKVDVNKLFESIEKTIQTFDPSSGDCKSRATTIKCFRHSHILVNLWLLTKPHRDQAFSQCLLDVVQQIIQKHIPSNCHLSLQLYYRDANYRTTP